MVPSMTKYSIPMTFAKSNHTTPDKTTNYTVSNEISRKPSHEENVLMMMNKTHMVSYFVKVDSCIMLLMSHDRPFKKKKM